jgi:hypothetical protein
MHRRCSPDSRYCRYLVVTKEVSPANVRRLLTETATTVAEALDGQLVAMGNVCLGGAEAELALLVEDGWHRRGLGVCLACVLAGQAVESGARVLTATVIGTNGRARRADGQAAAEDLRRLAVGERCLGVPRGPLLPVHRPQEWPARTRCAPRPVRRPALAAGRGGEPVAALPDRPGEPRHGFTSPAGHPACGIFLRSQPSGGRRVRGLNGYAR